MFLKFDVALDERAFVHLDGRPAFYLGPGRHRLWTAFRKVEVKRFKTDVLVADLAAEQMALVPAEDLRTVAVSAGQRALVTRRGRPALWLGVGEHRVWTVDRTVERRPDGSTSLRPAVTVEVLDTQAVEAAPLREEVKALVPAQDYVEVTVPAGAVALRYVDGVLDAELGPGRHAAWTTLRKVHFATLDLRERLLHVTGQEVMTKDRVTLRLNLTATYRVVDARRLATVAREPDDVLYLAMQMAGREAISTRTLDELLALRDALSGEIAAAVVGRAAAVGLEVIAFGLKDVILPGEMKALLNRVIEAQKEAEANVILRREETAATRSLAQTAKVLAENPLLVRLKELEAYKDLAAKVGQVHLVLGEGALSKLDLKV
jgi:hypothetical protein